MLNDENWVIGRSFKPREKAALLMLLLFAGVPFAIKGYYSSGYARLVFYGIFAFAFTFLSGAAFYRTWFCVNEPNKVLYVKKKFLLTWVKTYSYSGCCLELGGTPLDLSGPKDYGGGGTQYVLLVDSTSNRKQMLFSSGRSVDVLRVTAYLKKYISQC